jgi:hypothetical protein
MTYVRSLLRFLALAALIVLCGCQDTLVYGESTAFNLAIQVNDNPQTPIEVNAGLKRHIGEMAPPLAVKTSENGKTKADGEAVSSFSGFALTYEKNETFAIAGTLHIRTQFATGAAANELAEDPQQAAKVMKATFVRTPDFLSPEAQLRNERILEAIDVLPDARAVELACDPPTHDESMIEEANRLDPGCVLRKDPGYARDFLIDQALDDDRTDESFQDWEQALGLPPPQ